MAKSSRMLKGEAEKIGKAVGEGTLSAEDGIQALAAIVQELAQNLQRLVLQRLFTFPAPPPTPFDLAAAGVTQLRLTGTFLTPLGPNEDFVFVPLTQIEQMAKHGPYLGNGHLGLFFPPTVAAAGPGTARPA
jgi:hypothetical protein